MKKGVLILEISWLFLIYYKLSGNQKKSFFTVQYNLSKLKESQILAVGWRLFWNITGHWLTAFFQHQIFNILQSLEGEKHLSCLLKILTLFPYFPTNISKSNQNPRVVLIQIQSENHATSKGKTKGARCQIFSFHVLLKSSQICTFFNGGWAVLKTLN